MKKWNGKQPIIMITGDLVNDGEEAQFINAGNYLYRL